MKYGLFRTFFKLQKQMRSRAVSGVCTSFLFSNAFTIDSDFTATDDHERLYLQHVFMLTLFKPARIASAVMGLTSSTKR